MEARRGQQVPHVNYSIVHVSHHVNLSWSWARAVSALITSVMSPALRKYRKAKPLPTDPLSTEALSVVASTVHLLRPAAVYTRPCQAMASGSLTFTKALAETVVECTLKLKDIFLTFWSQFIPFPGSASPQPWKRGATLH